MSVEAHCWLPFQGLVVAIDLLPSKKDRRASREIAAQHVDLSPPTSIWKPIHGGSPPEFDRSLQPWCGGTATARSDAHTFEIARPQYVFLRVRPRRSLPRWMPPNEEL